MYAIEAAPQPGPGTELIERWTGMGAYFGTPSYFMTPAGQEGIRGMGYYEQRTAPQPGPGTQLVERWTGLGCGCAGCGCAGMGSLPLNSCGTTIDAGIFCSGTDFSQWGLEEWSIVIVGAYMLFSTLWTTKQAVSAGRRKIGAAGKALKRS